MPTIQRSSKTILLGLLILLTGACATLPDAPPVPATFALPPANAGPLAKAARQVGAATAGRDGLLLLPSAAEGMNWRLAMIDSAQHSIDLQYFTWASDESGALLLHRLILAAERGVRVRMLIDDLYLVSKNLYKSPDAGIAILDSHPNIEVKIFNPGRFRSGTVGLAGNFLGTFEEFNRRMHNKLLLADSRFAIIGGRNLANEYFGLHQPYNFLDLDLLLTGPVMPSVSAAFDIFWNAKPAFPAAGFDTTPKPEDLARLPGLLATHLAQRKDVLKAFALRPRDWSTRLNQLADTMVAAQTRFIQDKPVQLGARTYGLYDMLEGLGRSGDHETIIITPYLIPVGNFLEHLREAEAEGVQVRLLTASLAAGDHTAVHAHYQKHRRDILATGVDLYEFHHQPGPQLRALADTEPVRGDFVALHPKAAVSDRTRCFIGSLNLDPRAVEINTENGLLILSEAFCGRLADLLEVYLQPQNAWHVTLDERGKVQWTSAEGTVHKTPARSGGQRVSNFFFRLLPLEKQL